MNKKTAVEWLFEQLPDHLRLSKDGLDALNRAKEIEREQQEDTWINSRIEDKGDLYIGKQVDFNEYYSKTYGKP